MTNLADIAAALREHSPGVLPESLVIVAGTILAMKHSPVRETEGSISYSVVMLPDDIAEAVLRDAMHIDANNEGYLERVVRCRIDGQGWESTQKGDIKFSTLRIFRDVDHGGCTGACYQAWRWAKGLKDA